MLKTLALASAVFVLTGMTATAQEGPTLERVWFDEYESACMAQMSTGEMGEVEAATWFRVAAARENKALSSFYTILDTISQARRNDGEAGVIQHDKNGWACKSGVVMTNLLQELGFPLTSENLLGAIRILSSKYSDPEVVLSSAPDAPIIGAAVHMTNSDTQQGYLNAQFYLLRLLGGELTAFASWEGDATMGGLPITVIAPSLSGVTVRSGGADFDGETIMQLWRDRQRLFGAGLWSGSSPGFAYFSDDQGTVYVAGTDASQDFRITSFKPSEPQIKYTELYKRIAAEGFIGDDIYKEAERRLASAHPAFDIMMAHVNVHDAWQYTNFFLDGKMTRPLHEVVSSVNVAIQELE